MRHPVQPQEYGPGGRSRPTAIKPLRVVHEQALQDLPGTRWARLRMVWQPAGVASNSRGRADRGATFMVASRGALGFRKKHRDAARGTRTRERRVPNPMEERLQAVVRAPEYTRR